MGNDKEREPPRVLSFENKKPRRGDSFAKIKQLAGK